MQLEIANKFPALIDSSMRSDFVACPRQFQWRTMYNLAQLQPSIHLHAGATFAKGIETFRLKYYRDGLDIANSFADAMAAMILEWGDFEPAWSWDDELENKSLDRLIIALGMYIEQYNPMTDHIQPRIVNGVPSVEFTFALPIPDVYHPDTGEPLLYAGRFDMIGVYNEAEFNVDEKTTKQFGPTWAQQWRMRGQFIGYAWAAREYGHTTVGTIVRGIRFTKTAIDFQEAIVYHPQWEIDRWLIQLQHDAQRMIQCYENGYFDYDLSSACSSYGGCSYRTLCESETPERWVDGYYTRRIWNPLDPNPEEGESYAETNDRLIANMR